MKSLSSAAAGNLLKTPRPSAPARGRSNRCSESNSVCSSGDLFKCYSDSSNSRSSDLSSKISKIVSKSLSTDFSAVSEVSTLSDFSDPLPDPAIITGGSDSEVELPQNAELVDTIVAEKSFSGLKQGVSEVMLDGGDRSDDIAKLVISLCELVLETKGSGSVRRKGLSDPVMRAKLRFITVVMLFVVIAVAGLLRLELQGKNSSINFAGLAPT